MGRMYAVAFTNRAFALADGTIDVFSIIPATQKPCILHSIKLDNVGTSGVGDAEEEMVQFELIRGYTTVGSGGAVITATPLDPNDAAAGFTARHDDTTVATVGTPVLCGSFGWNIRVPFREVFTPEERVTWKYAEHLVFRLAQAIVQTPQNWSGTAIVEEL